MSYLTIERNENPTGVKIANFNYGTFVTDVPNGNGCVYIKVKKTGDVKELSLSWNRGHCVLLNVKYGTLRQVPGDTCVTALKPALSVHPLKDKECNEALKAHHRQFA